MRKFICLLCVCFMLISVVGCNSSTVQTGGQPENDLSSSEIREKDEFTSARVMAVGDNLIHKSIYNQANERAGGKGYDFEYAYKNMEQVIKLADLPIINQETVIAPDYEPSDYPCFNSPKQLAIHLIKMGFKAFNHANNHILDKGVGGLKSQFEYWDKLKNRHDIVDTGIYKNQQDLSKPKLLTVNDIVFSFIGATDHTNGISLPDDTDIKLILTSNEAEIKRQIQIASESSDVVVMNVHWGTEDSHVITDSQRRLAHKMANWGADIIIGTHPHVIQSFELINGKDNTKVPCIYSLGNFISAQSEAPNMIGGLLDMTVTKNLSNGKITISDYGFLPLINHYDAGFKNIRIYPYYMYSENLADSHGVRAYDSRFDYDFINQTIKDNIKNRYVIKDKLS